MDDTPGAVVDYRCNICGAANSRARDAFDRETPDCVRCGSSPRMRGLVHALSLALFGRSAPMPSWPERKDLRGLGFSDSGVYASPLAWKTRFVNTFLHREPRLDLLSDSDWRTFAPNDFLICAEVLEHVPPPFERALATLRDLVAPGGVAVISTPFTDRSTTKEHFPGLDGSHFEIVRDDDRWVVVSEKPREARRIFDRDVRFHGGAGLVLEMRTFAGCELLRQLAAAGFACTVHDAPVPEIGYLWPGREQRPGDGVSLDHIITAVAV